MRGRVGLLAILALALSAYGQTFRGSVEGNVTDSTGAAITKATVTATSTGTGLVRTTTTDDQGNYYISELPLGTYDVSATRQGFQTTTTKNVRVDVATRAHLDFQLKPGEVKESVVVSEEVPLVETTVNNLGGTIGGREANELPVNGGDFTKLLIMVPGATGDNSGGADSPGSFGLFSANGSRGRANNYLLDGTDMNDGYRNLPAINQGGVFGTPSTILPLDALAEIPVISNGEAEYGRNSGAIVNMVTKSGTNGLHGTIYEFFRNNALDARNFFNKAPDPANQFHNNQFGGSLGGPIVKDRTFFFLAYEGQRESGGLPFTNHVPTQGDIARTSCGANPDPTVNSIADKIVCQLQPWGPVANLPIGGPGGADVLQTVHFNNRVDSLIGKIDQHLGQNDLLTGRYFFGDSYQSFPLALLGGGTVPGYNTNTPTRVQILSLSYTHVLGPKTLLELRGGWNRFNEDFFPQDSTFNPATIGLDNGASPQDYGLPLILIGSPGVVCSTPPCPVYAPIGANASVPRGRIDTNWQWFANASHNSGKHNVKWGYEFRRTAVNGFFDAGYRGKLAFTDFQSFLNGDTGGTSSHQMLGDSHRHTFQNSDALYVQDNWRVTPRFTVNLGLRWDYFGVIGEKNGLFSVFDPTLLSTADGGTCTAALCIPTRQVSQLYPKDYNNFAPRASFAWDMFGHGKTVLRAGFGIFYDAFSQDFFVGQLPWPTYNSGPAYNYLGPNNAASISESYCVGGPSSNGGSSTCTGHLFPGMPVFDYGCNTQGCPFGNDTFTVSQNLRTPYVMNYNLNIEHQLGGHTALQVGYVGSQGRHLFDYYDANQVNPATGSNPYGYPTGMGYGYLLQFESQASSSYNSLQTSLRMRNMHGVTSMVNYTWSHAIDNASDGQDYVPNATQPDNSYNRAAERASSNFDQRHRFIWDLTYEFPKSTFMKPVLSGWMVDSVVTLTSGNPYNVSWGTETFLSDFNGTGEFYGRPDVVGNPYGSLGTDPSGAPQILNLGALAVPCNYPTCDSKHIGNLGRNAFVGPPFRAWDFSLVKNTPLFGERLNMQLRADFFNILNHPNFANPLWPNFEVDMLHNGINANGTGVGYLAPTVTPDVGLGNPYLGGGGPRNIQLALRFSF